MRHTEQWITDWFAKISKLPEGFKFQNYFELGLIDSFGVLELIDDLETEFGIKFSEQHFQDRRFASVSGLTEIVSELLEDKAEL
ncbi:MAG: hypothetical protein KKE17_07580 [Proteobacteria bacterium]|nr:hypothetical protein [Pseudomonadota bacterium]MBU1709848.1 hypothetical protein [Pseudomonadota bacterium]